MDKRTERFWSNVGPKNENGCRLWQGKVDPHGYAHVTYKGWRTTGHRIAYALVNGPIPEGMVIMHTCDTPSCCNPEHLRMGTQKENIHDMIQKGRAGDCRVFGEYHGRCKVTTEQVAEIRNLYKTTRVSQQTLADKFGLGQTHISRIVRQENRRQG